MGSFIHHGAQTLGQRAQKRRNIYHTQICCFDDGYSSRCGSVVVCSKLSKHKTIVVFGFYDTYEVWYDNYVDDAAELTIGIVLALSLSLSDIYKTQLILLSFFLFVCATFVVLPNNSFALSLACALPASQHSAAVWKNKIVAQEDATKRGGGWRHRENVCVCMCAVYSIYFLHKSFVVFISVI